MDKNYYLGLDIGTNSVGWAVTDEEYHLCKFRGKELWGIRLFESADTAADRRMNRTARRRLQRRNQRLKLLQELFSEEIAKVDPTFFIRLNESMLHPEDKSVDAKYTLFNEDNYTDIDYYAQYPTIFSLRKELIANKEPHDIRLVYLAIHNIMKHRGHFLIDGDLNAVKDFNGTFETMINALNEELGLDLYLSKDDREEFESVLKNRDFAKSVKSKRLTNLLFVDNKDKTKDELKVEKNKITQICNFVVGNKGNVSKLLDETPEGLEKESFKLSDADYEDVVRVNLEEIIPEKSYIFDSMKAIYDWSILVDLLDGEEYISFAKDRDYYKHKENLHLLRTFMKKYCDRKVYKSFFDSADEKANYSSYVGYVKKNGKKYSVKDCSEEDFYKNVKKILEGMKVSDEDRTTYEYLKAETERFSLLPIQRNKDNGVVPNQINKAELVAILNNAKEYLPFLNNESEGTTVAEKIISVFSFRVPYYVGPLSDRHAKEGANAWIVRKKDGYIYPWNFEEIVDKEKSNEAFIKRMTNKCTYLLGEDVLPKQSLLYSKYMVLNELNNLKIRGHKVPVTTKQDIFNELFLCYKRVTTPKLLAFLKTQDPSLKKEDLSGFDIEFKSSMAPYIDFKKNVFGDRISEEEIQEIIENCIKWITIYGDDKTMIKSVIKKNYVDTLTDAEIKEICKLRYSGWGNFSEKFLKGIEGTNTETGEVASIISALWNTNNNLMQLLSKRFTYTEVVSEYNKSLFGEVKEFTYDSLVKDLYVSPANKRSIWQTLQIVQEIVKIMGGQPKKIFVEMARGGEKEPKRKKSRKQRLLDLYNSCEEDVREWTDAIEKHDERDFNSMKLYLYYSQMGKCMYTGEPIDIDELMSGNSRWDRDHIYPQSKIKDDSLDNLVLVKKNVNAKKNNELLSADIQAKNKAWWAKLQKIGLISKKKYDRLTRTGDFTEDELAGFISRQLVETRQSSKAVAELLDRVYTDSEIVYVKAKLASDFRKHPLHMLKSRRINDYHHAKDAYLNIVVGNVYNARFTSNPLQWLKKNRDTNYSINAVFSWDVKRGETVVWNGVKKDNPNASETFITVRNTMKQNNILYTEYTYCDKGELFEANASGKNSGAKIPVKAGLDPEKYGGYKGANTSYFAMVEFDGKKGERVRNIIGVPIYVANLLEQDQNAFIRYCENIKQLKNVKVLHEKIKKNSLLVVDGFPMRIRGENEKNNLLKGNQQLILDEEKEETVRLIEKYIEKETGFEVNAKYDKLTDEIMLALFEELTRKLQSKAYIKRPANQVSKLVDGKGVFETISLTQKVKELNEILTFFRCDIETTGSLKLIGGSDNAGNMAMNKNTLGKCKVVLHNQSVTGVFENKKEL